MSKKSNDIFFWHVDANPHIDSTCGMDQVAMVEDALFARMCPTIPMPRLWASTSPNVKAHELDIRVCLFGMNRNRPKSLFQRRVFG